MQFVLYHFVILHKFVILAIREWKNLMFYRATHNPDETSFITFSSDLYMLNDESVFAIYWRLNKFVFKMSF